MEVYLHTFITSKHDGGWDKWGNSCGTLRFYWLCSIISPIFLEYLYWGLHTIVIQCIVVTWGDIFRAVTVLGGFLLLLCYLRLSRRPRDIRYRYYFLSPKQRDARSSAVPYAHFVPHREQCIIKANRTNMRGYLSQYSVFVKTLKENRNFLTKLSRSSKHETLRKFVQWQSRCSQEVRHAHVQTDGRTEERGQ
jgi:hypothetical protein